MLSESGSESENTAIPWTSPLAPTFLSKESESTLIPWSSSQAQRSSSTELVWLYQNNHSNHINVVRLIIKIIRMTTLMAIPIILIITMTTMITNNMFNLTNTIKLQHRRNKMTHFPAFSFAWTSSASEWKVFFWLSAFSLFNVFWSYLFNKRTQIIWNECTNNLIRLDLLGLSIHKSDSQSTWTSPFQAWAPKKNHFLVEIMF